MAAPPETNINHLDGKFVMNKSLGDDLDPMLALQGLSWFVRKAISFATLSLDIKEYEDDSSVIHIDIVSVASGLSTTQENRILDWAERDHNDKTFGQVRGRSRMFSADNFEMTTPGGDENDATFLKGEKLKDLKTDSSFLEAEHVQSFVVSQGGGWTAEQIWGFEEIKGKRYYTRRIVVRKGNDVQRVRLVYEFQGKSTAEQEEDDGMAYGEEN